LCALIVVTLGLSWLMLHEPALRLMATTVEALERERSMRERLALVAYSTTNSVIIMDPEARIEWTNQAFTQLSGYTLDEVRGKRPNAFLHGPETDPAVSARIQQAIARGEGFKERIANYARDGRAYWLVVDCQPLHDADGQLSGFMAVQSEITSMLEMERKLTKQAERYGIAMAAASMGVWEWDVRTGVLDYDEHHHALFGIDPPRAGPRDTDWRSRVVPEDLPAIEQSLTRALRGDGHYGSQFRVRHGDGRNVG
jgi:PAS domain S-box-containing protein